MWIYKILLCFCAFFCRFVVYFYTVLCELK